MGTGDWLADTRASYDAVAASYPAVVGRYPEGYPHDRAGLALFADLVRAGGGGPVVDLGCGPGHLTAHLRDLGLEASGIDLSPGMVAVARGRHPELRFEVGSMTHLDLPDSSVAGYLAWCSLVHVPDEEVPGVLARAARVLRPGGVVLVGFHIGEGRRLKTHGYGGHPMRVPVHRRSPGRVSSWLLDAGTVESQIVQDPGADVPHGRVVARRER